MAYRTVLAVFGVAEGDREVDRAAAVAAALDAHLTALVVGIAPPPPSSPYGVVSNDVWAVEIQEGQEAARVRAEAVKARMAAAGVKVDVDAQYVDRGTVASLAARAARYADLALIAPQAIDPLQGWAVNGALFESGRPVLLLPKGESPFPKVGRAVIAWDASVEAAKAVRDAIGLLQGAREVHAILIDPEPSFEGHGPEPGADIAAYLSRHGVSTTVHKLPREGRDVAEVIRRSVIDIDADLLVMGGFGHSRLRERIFGGTTTSILKNPPVATLMAH